MAYLYTGKYYFEKKHKKFSSLINNENKVHTLIIRLIIIKYIIIIIAQFYRR